MVRGNGKLVPENDEAWLRFWAAYPWRAGKLDARKAWLQVEAAGQLTEILRALEWQVPLWTRLGYGTPMPASYLRGRRWEDEPLPMSAPDRRPAWLQKATRPQ